MSDTKQYELLRCHSCGRPRYWDEVKGKDGEPAMATRCPGCGGGFLSKVNPPTTYYILRFLLRYPRLIPRFFREDLVPILRGQA